VRQMIVCIVFSLWAAVAQAALADISIEASNPLGSFLAPGTRDTITITIRNAGPEPTGTIFMRASQYQIQIVQEIGLFRLSGPNACAIGFDDLITPTGDVFVFAGITFPGLQPGESRSCDFGIIAFGQGVNAYRLVLQLVAPNDTDPNPQNNRAVLQFNFFSAMPVPTLNVFSAVLIAGFISFSGLLLLRKSR